MSSPEEPQSNSERWLIEQLILRRQQHLRITVVFDVLRCDGRPRVGVLGIFMHLYRIPCESKKSLFIMACLMMSATAINDGVSSRKMMSLYCTPIK